MLFTEIMVLLVFACVVVLLWLKSNYNYWRQNGIPYIKPTPILGNTKVIFTLQNSFGLHLSEMYNDKKVANEPVVGIYTLNKPALIIRDPDILKSVLIKEFNKFSNRYGACDPHGDSLGSNNLFFVKNPEWKAIRTKLTPVFTSGKIKQMYPLMQEIGAELETYLATQEKSGNSFVTEVKEVCALFTTDLIATIAFGIRVNSLKNPNNEFRMQGRKLFDFTLKRGFEFFVAFFLPKLVTLFRVKLFTKSFSKFVRATINYVMSERERSGTIRNDLIDILVTLKKEAELESDPNYFAKNNDFLVAQAAVFLTAGFETSSSTMAFALYELAKQPELQDRLRQEINEALVEGGGELSYEKIHALEYLSMVVDEVLRLYPVLPFLDRQCNIPKGETGFSLKPHFNYEIPEGMAVYIPIFGIQRDPKYWSNPDQFDPERFSHENKQHHNPMAYLPFGTGPHNCIGSRIGLLQTKIGLVHIFKNHYVETCDKTVKEMKFDPMALVLQCQDGIYLNVVNDGLYYKSQT